VTQASDIAYEQAVGTTCDALNEADRARVRNARRLARRLSHARTTLAQRNALLDSTKQLLAASEQALADFKGLNVPRARAGLAHDTASVWDRMVERLHGYAQRLDSATNRDEFLATVKTLPTMRTVLARDGVKRGAGLTKLGNGRCKLEKPMVTRAVTLPDSRTSVTPPSLSSRSPTRSTNPHRNVGSSNATPAGSAFAGQGPSAGARLPTSVSPSGDPVDPSVDPVSPSVDPVSPSVDPPTNASPGGKLRVIEAVARANPSNGTVTCPVEIQFGGRISVEGSGRVSYRWIRSDGALGPVQILNFDGSSSREATTTWTRGAPGSKLTGWQAIHIIDPQGVDSNRAEFDLSCSGQSTGTTNPALTGTTTNPASTGTTTNPAGLTPGEP
jgi:hypothetical protein